MKQSGRNWNQMLHSFLTENDFEQSVSDIAFIPNRPRKK